MHVAAKLGKEEAARLVLHWVVGGDLVGRLYPDEVGNLDERVARLSDSTCQTRELVTHLFIWRPSLVEWGLGLGDIADKSLKHLKTIPDKCNPM